MNSARATLGTASMSSWRALASSWVRLSSMYAVNWFSASRSLNMFSAFTATRVKEPMMSRQQIIMQTAAKDIKP